MLQTLYSLGFLGTSIKSIFLLAEKHNNIDVKQRQILTKLLAWTAFYKI